MKKKKRAGSKSKNKKHAIKHRKKHSTYKKTRHAFKHLKKKTEHKSAKNRKLKNHKHKPKKTHFRLGKISKKFGRVSTGIPNFDKLIGKGFDKNSTNLLVGGSGSGKTIFATQFLIEGMRKGENCLYVTFEEKKEQFYLNMKQFGWDLEKLEKKGSFTFLQYTPMKVKTMLEEGGGAIESIILKNKISRIVIDSITSFELLFNEELEKREAALALFSMIRDWNATALLTLEEEPSTQEKISSRTLEFESDSIIVLYFIRAPNKPERQRYLEVIKMRGTEHSKKVYPFQIARNGIRIGSSPISHFSIV